MFQTFVTCGWIIANTVIFSIMMIIRHGKEGGVLVSVLYPGVGRLCWSLATAFMVLATASQHGNGEPIFFLILKDRN